MRSSLQGQRSARTVLLQMARDEERGKRIRALKEAHPEITWRQIADSVGVSERAAAAWPKTGGIAYENAKKLATVFRKAGDDIDVDYIWRGPQLPTPDLIASLGAEANDGAGQLDRIERKLDETQQLMWLVARHAGVITDTESPREFVERAVDEFIQEREADAAAEAQAHQAARHEPSKRAGTKR